MAWWAWLLLSALCWTTVAVSGGRTPVILLPGLGASQLWASQTGEVRSECRRSSKNGSLLWLGLYDVILHSCLVEGMTLTYNHTSNRTEDAPGWDVHVKDFGDTSTVERLNPWVPSYHPKKMDFVAAFAPLVRRLLEKNYTRGVDVLGAPYDFRRGPDEVENFYKALQALVEQGYSSSDNTPVVLVAHSMGGLHVHHFLSRLDQAWKDRYIRAIVTLSSPWGGSVKAIRSIVSGIRVPTVASLTMRGALRSFPSTSWLLTSPRFWKASEVLVATSQRHYTQGTLGQLMLDVGAQDSLEFWRKLNKSSDFRAPPGVEVHCLYGTNVRTQAQLLYMEGSKDWFNNTPEIVYGPGDGTVNKRSLEGCLPWVGRQKQPVSIQSFPGTGHVEMPGSKAVFDYIWDKLLQP